MELGGAVSAGTSLALQQAAGTRAIPCHSPCSRSPSRRLRRRRQLPRARPRVHRQHDRQRRAARVPDRRRGRAPDRRSAALAGRLSVRIGLRGSAGGGGRRIAPVQSRRARVEAVRSCAAAPSLRPRSTVSGQSPATRRSCSWSRDGGPNATVASLRSPDMTTTVLTMTLTALAADSKLAGGTAAAPTRRIVPSSRCWRARRRRPDGQDRRRRSRSWPRGRPRARHPRCNHPHKGARRPSTFPGAPTRRRESGRPTTVRSRTTRITGAWLIHQVTFAVLGACLGRLNGDRAVQSLVAPALPDIQHPSTRR